MRALSSGTRRCGRLRLTSNGLLRSTSPFSDRVPLRGITWLEPTLVAEVSYSNMTAKGLRAPVFRGFHE